MFVSKQQFKAINTPVVPMSENWIIMLVLSHSAVSNFLWPHGLQPPRLLCPWNSPGKNTGVGCHFLLQRTFLPGMNPTCPALAVGFLLLSHLGRPKLDYSGDKTSLFKMYVALFIRQSDALKCPQKCHCTYILGGSLQTSQELTTL